jgi:AbrB family looped-hinge helix DNA binding protein
MTMRCTVTSKGQITLPAQLRRKYNICKGDVLELDPQSANIAIRRLKTEGTRTVAELIGFIDALGAGQNEPAPLSKFDQHIADGAVASFERRHESGSD